MKKFYPGRFSHLSGTSYLAKNRTARLNEAVELIYSLGKGFSQK